MIEDLLKEISESLKIIIQQGSKPFYFTQEFWTASATIVALFVAFFTIWWSNKPKKSNLKVEGVSIVNQDPAQEEDEKNLSRLLNVGRIVIKNLGKYKAQSVEAYIEKINFQGKEREDYFPIPLFWTHGQLNKYGPTVRDIYPNQTVYLDIYNHIYTDEYDGNSIVKFAVAAGDNLENLSRANLGESEVIIKMYQESGQVDHIHLNIYWDGKSAPKLAIV